MQFAFLLLAVLATMAAVRMVARFGMAEGMLPFMQHVDWRSVGAVVRGRPTLDHAAGSLGTLWTLQLGALVILSAMPVIRPGMAVASPNQNLAMGTATLESLLGLMLTAIELRQFRLEGHLLDLFAGLAFGTLSLVSLSVRVGGLITGMAIGSPMSTAYLLLIGQVFVSGLLVAGAVALGRFAAPARRWAIVWLVVGVVALLLVATAGVVLVTVGDPLVEQPVWAELNNGSTISNSLPGQKPWLLVINGACLLLMLAASRGYVRAWRRYSRARDGVLAAALCVMSFSQLHTMLFPPVAARYVTTADALRLIALIGAVAGLTALARTEVVRRASHDERLRLSRDLHDGLVQQLCLLQLRLARAARGDRLPEDRDRDVEIAQRLSESALLEARRVMESLRAKSLSWEHVLRVISTFADEFATNHQIEVRLQPEGTMRQVDAAFQREMLMLMHEAFSNAIRHGAASRITVKVVASDDHCDLTVHDNGRGFDVVPTVSRRGVGLDSMIERLQRRGGRLSIDSTPGSGTTVSACLRTTDQAVSG